MSRVEEQANGPGSLSFEMKEMGRLIATLPDGQRHVFAARFIALSMAIAADLATTHDKFMSIIDMIQDAKVDTAYLCLDLEATRRERDRYKVILGDRE